MEVNSKVFKRKDTLDQQQYAFKKDKVQMNSVERKIMKNSKQMREHVAAMKSVFGSSFKRAKEIAFENTRLNKLNKLYIEYSAKHGGWTLFMQSEGKTSAIFTHQNRSIVLDKYLEKANNLIASNSLFIQETL